MRNEKLMYAFIQPDAHHSLLKTLKGGVFHAHDDR